MTRLTPTRRGADSCGRFARLIVGLVVALTISGVAVGPGTAAKAGQMSESCNPLVLNNARISWSALQRDLGAPAASGAIVEEVSRLIAQIYRPDGTGDVTALDRLATPGFRKMIGLDCTGVSVPPPATPLAPADQMRLDQVRQVDATTVSAFISQPGMGTAAMTSPLATPSPGAASIDAVGFVVLVQQGGTWKIDYFSYGVITISDVVPKDQQLRNHSLGGYLVNAIDLRDHGMPSLPADFTLLATPAATPGN